MRGKEFLNKLAKLLAVYNAKIWFSCSPISDTRWLHNGRITVSMNYNVILDTGSDLYLSSNNIKENIKP